MYKKILIATDGSALSDIGVRHGIDLARQLNAEVLLVSATEPFRLLSSDPGRLSETPDEYRAHMRAQAELILRPAAERAAMMSVTAETLHLETEEPSAGIIAAAQDHGCDLIVMASHGRSGLTAMVLGSETSRVLAHSSIPVLVVRAEDADLVRPAGVATQAGRATFGGIPEGIVMAPARR